MGGEKAYLAEIKNLEKKLPKIEVRVVSLSGSEMVLKLAPSQARGDHEVRRLVRSEWPVTASQEYKLLKGDAELKNSDTLKEGDVITAVVSEVPISSFASSIKALNLQPMLGKVPRLSSRHSQLLR